MTGNKYRTPFDATSVVYNCEELCDKVVVVVVVVVFFFPFLVVPVLEDSGMCCFGCCLSVC